MSYVSEAAELFLTLNPDVPFLSPFDYLVLAEWEKQEIPLGLVLNAIREFSGNIHDATPDPVCHLNQAVSKSFTAWLNKEGNSIGSCTT